MARTIKISTSWRIDRAGKCPNNGPDSGKGCRVNQRRVGRSSLTVSEIGLGTSNFGCQVDEVSAYAIMDAAVEGGITLFDTADVYPA
jgi:hypothetical protein